MKRMDFVVIGSILLLAAAVYLVFNLNDSGAAVAVVYVSGDEYARLPLNKPAEIVIAQEDGRENHVVVNEEGRVYMRYASCPDGVCVAHSPLGADSVFLDALYDWIICLPNEVSIEIEG